MRTKVKTVRPEAPEEEILAEAGRILRAGGLVAFPTETVYGLGGNALDPEASRKIYAAKGRPSDNPLIVHIADPEELPPLVKSIPENARLLMDAFWPGPMTLVFEKSGIVPKETTGGLDTVAVRMPSDPVAAAMIRAAGVPVAAPSANASGRPSPTRASHVEEDLGGRIDMILDGGDVGIGLESTIIDVTGEEPTILRPGYITRDMIRAVCGAAGVDPAILGRPDPSLRPKAPGMKYRHYAPKAELTILRGERAAVAAAMRERALSAAAEGRTCGLICTEELMPMLAGLSEDERIRPVCIGRRADTESVAHNLYRVLREMDELGTDVIWSESFDGEGLSAAVMNRLVKAAGYRIENV